MKSSILASILVLCAATANAFSLDLTSPGAVGVIDGAIFQQVDPLGTGSGAIDSFVRIQETGTEQGYNTSGGTPFDTKSGQADGKNFTHDVQLGDIPVVGDYRAFLLDINETGGSGETLSLFSLQFFLRPTGGATTENLADFGTPVWSLDRLTDNVIELLNNSGSGAGDMLAYIPNSVFAGASEDSYLILYSAFGSPNPSDDGYEEWATVERAPVPPVVPEPGTMMLLGCGLFVATLYSKRRMTAV
ncbi:PEP-CTERM sorting domain-containing protein [Geomonas sp. RF6]|uniref:PEP-CTERM sorting domain-containing protein n=1 Tax=Geomonas sp. RF6 TaxID=2897342 RepID=UPI001E339637|nr:PEP-CTERM sorting domain-containing protein [Geomonas sp. RF6]UFS69949.1 PEP-CTERM sorting domain-containing protein [Geomonas sp. RF6]